MKTDKSLKEKIDDAEKFMPGIKNKLEKKKWEDRDPFGLVTYEIFPADVKYAETDTYQVVAAMMRGQFLSRIGGRHPKWISVHYRKKGLPNEAIKHKDTERIEEDQTFGDFVYEGAGRSVSLYPLESDQVEVEWYCGRLHDHRYTLDLKE